jgi:histidine triad (HIT) family protein
MPSIFTRIIAGEIPCYKVAENEDFFAFLDISPVEKGHTLVVPKKEVDYIFDLPEAEYIALQLFARRVAIALEAAVPCKRIATAVVGLEVPHTHIHLVPLDKLPFINFSGKRVNMTSDELAATAAAIAQKFDNINL